MDDQQTRIERPANPRRRKRTRFEVFKEAYLPTIIVGLALVLILIFLIGSITRGVQRSRYNKDVALKESIAAEQDRIAMDAQAESISQEASFRAAQFDYVGAIELIESFTGNIEDYPALSEKKATYEAAMQEMILWDNPADVLSLSLHVLIEDPQRAFTDETYGTSYNRNFLTTAEFRTILQQLYENGYILVSLEDISAAEGMTLYLPADKKPLLLTQTNINYYNYMTDSDGDFLPDAGGDGFASKLIVDANGNVTCQMTDAQGQTVTGPYDMVPILESFIQTHPDFSYKNAKAVLAVTGYNGIFGYRINPEAKEYLGDGGYEMEIEDAKQLCSKLRDLGYELACYTFGNESYGLIETQLVSKDQENWNNQVVPVMGKTNILVYAQGSDISNSTTPYSGEKYELLSNCGFTSFLGFCSANEPWAEDGDGYFRIGRILLTGSSLAHNSAWFEGILDASAILDQSRGNVPA